MSEPKATKITVLIAEDDALIRLMWRSMMESMGCEVVGEASNGQEAVELFRKTRPMLALLDINMPVMTGKEALAEIIEEFPNAIIIIMSAISVMGSVKECLELGAANYIRKDTPTAEMKLLIKETWNDMTKSGKPPPNIGD